MQQQLHRRREGDLEGLNQTVYMYLNRVFPEIEERWVFRHFGIC